MRKIVLTNLSVFLLFLVTGCSIHRNIPVHQMARKAKFETYTFSPNPQWTEQAQITELDFFGQQTFITAYCADDGRHVVLTQNSSYKKKLAPKIKKEGKIVYTSPNNFKIWRGEERERGEKREKWFSKILLKSASHITDDKPADERTGYAIESSDESFILLAINGPVTEHKLHQLVNNLITRSRI